MVSVKGTYKIEQMWLTRLFCGFFQGSPPLVVSRGDNGILPDQTQFAYKFAKRDGLSSSSAFLCDVQITKDNVLICRTGLDLGRSTTINKTFPNLHTQLDVNGQTVSGFFSINITADLVANNISGTISSLFAFIYDLGWIEYVKDNEFHNVTQLFRSQKMLTQGFESCN